MERNKTAIVYEKMHKSRRVAFAETFRLCTTGYVSPAASFHGKELAKRFDSKRQHLK